MNPDFKRTTCACAECVRCCKRQPGSLAHGDYERIQNHLGLTEAEMRERFCASPGALVMDRRTGAVRRVGTIVPQMRRGRCVFLDKDERCTIHGVAPFGCAYFDTHQSAEQAMPRSIWLVHSQENPEYQQLRNLLPYARSYKPSTF
jgi:Fe-S-cluster containining protein